MSRALEVAGWWLAVLLVAGSLQVLAQATTSPASAVTNAPPPEAPGEARTPTERRKCAGQRV